MTEAERDEEVIVVHSPPDKGKKFKFQKKEDDDEQVPLKTPAWVKHTPHPDPKVREYQEDYYQRVFPCTPLPEALVRTLVEYLEPDPIKFNAESIRNLTRRNTWKERRYRSREDQLKTCLLVTFTIFSVSFMLGLLALFAWSIYIGRHTNGEKCGGHDLPMWITVYGSVGIVHLVLSTAEKAKDKSTNYVTNCMGLFSTAWFILGSVWVYKLDYYYPGCNYNLFYTVYWVITGSWIFLAVVCVLSCCVLVCTLIMKNR